MIGRIDKLLQTEYEELLNESLLVESPFAETTRDGHGLREVALGLTSSKLIVASDNLGNNNNVFWCEKHVDPSIESLELKSIYPLEYVKLSVFRWKKRKALEARLIDGRAKYYELGGIGCRARNWNEWCMQVHRLLPNNSKVIKNIRKHSCNGWTKKHLYLGPDYEELWDEHYTPKPTILATASFDSIKDEFISPSSLPLPRKKTIRRVQVPRFAQGVDEKCSHPLYIQLSQSSSENLTIQREISPNSHLLRGLGLWSINPGDRVSLQSRFTQSLVNIRRRDYVSKRRLTVSLENLTLTVSTRSAILFWTKDYWYRPRSNFEVYGDNHHHSTTRHLRKLLKLHNDITLREISSTTLSRQLTLIDRELFTRITINEIRILAQRRESRDAPNFSAWIAFAHRITCLLASEVLRIKEIEERTRILARLIRTAEKCIEQGNFQSASSIVAALQSPAVYRLKATWSYLKSSHRTKYNTMAILSKLFENTKSRQYHEAWMNVENNCRKSSLMPCVADVCTRILGLQDVEIYGDGDLKILGIRLSRLIFGDSPTNKIDRLVNWLENCQSLALNYDYQRESLAWEFLLKARYREDCENFLLSFHLEPS